MIRVAKKGQPSRECTIEEINRLLASGELSVDDTAWHEGLPKWMPLHSIRGVRTDVKPAVTPSSSGSMSNAKPKSWKTTVGGRTTIWRPAQGPAAEHALWDPNTAALWSLLFGCSPVFGAIIVAANWKTLGDASRARQNWFCVWLALALHVTGFVLLLSQVSVECVIVALLNGGFLAVWYVFFCRKQVAHMRREVRGLFIRKPWIQPLVFGFVCLIGYLVSCIVIGWFQGQFSPPPPPAAPQTSPQEPAAKRE
jgi:hypothetical protein